MLWQKLVISDTEEVDGRRTRIGWKKRYKLFTNFLGVGTRCEWNWNDAFRIEFKICPRLVWPKNIFYWKFIQKFFEKQLLFTINTIFNLCFSFHLSQAFPKVRHSQTIKMIHEHCGKVNTDNIISDISVISDSREHTGIQENGNQITHFFRTM